MEIADRVHGRALAESCRLGRALAALREFAAGGPCHISFSGGKDSTALVGLARLAGLDLPVVWFRGQPKHNPDVPRVIDSLGVAVDVVDYESPVPAGRLTNFAAEERATRCFLAACNRYEHANGRRVLGVRSDESGTRRIKMRFHGLTTKNSCTPLGWWTTSDVFGFLAAQDLPVHPVYAMLGGGRWDRTRIRVDALMGERGDQFGRREWEQEYYGDILRRLEVTTLQSAASPATPARFTAGSRRS
jgi:phosphoadenosine phosphosulfate reductase